MALTGWKKEVVDTLASVAAGAGLALLGIAAVQAWLDGLEGAPWALLATVVAALVLILTWKKVEPASRALLSFALLVGTVGALALIHGPRDPDAWRIGPLSLAALVDLAILLTGGLSLIVLLTRSGRLRKGWRVAIGLLGAALLAPFAFGVWRGLPLADLYSGPGLLAPLPTWCQPAVLGALLLLPISLIILSISLVRALRSEERSTLRAVLLVLCAAVPLAVAVHGLVVQPADGLAMRAFADHGWTSLEVRSVASGPELRWDEPVAGADGEFWVEWEGSIHLPDGGQRRLRLVADGASGYLYLDGVRLLDGLEETPPLELEPGLHRLRVAAIASAASGSFAVEQSIDGGPWHQLPGALLSHDADDADWSRTPRQAAQVGLEWLQSSAVEWQREHRCFGCHVQAQALLGMRVARDNRYEVNPDVWQELAALTRQTQRPDGAWHDTSQLAATQYAAMALACAGPPQGESEDPALLRAAEWLDVHQLDSGELPIDADEPPIDQGSLMTTANGIFALRAVSSPLEERRWHRAADRGLDWIRQAPPETTQDRAMQLLALSREGGNHRLEDRRHAELLAAQEQDGSWRETTELDGGNAYATGQALYALKLAGEPVGSADFTSGVRFLMEGQRITGQWVSANTGSRRPSDFAPTMWAVIGLAGSFGELNPEIVEPVDGASVQGTTLLEAEVSNFTGSELREVVFALDGADLGPAQLEPESGRWQRSWQAEGLADGPHELAVVASTVSGAVGEDRVEVHAGQGIRVVIEVPDQDHRLSTDQHVAARAQGLFGQEVERVEFLLDAQPLPAATPVSPEGLWVLRWDTSEVEPGPHRLEAVATGADGQEARDEVGVIKEAPLTVEIEEPADGAVVAGSQPCTARVRVDPTLVVDRLLWTLDGQPFAESLLPDAAGAPIRASIACDFSRALPGEHELAAIADDGQGQRAEDRVTVRVGEAPGPGYLRVQLEDPDRPGEQLLFFAPEQVELVLDMSGSMWGRVPGGTKADVAREVLGRLVQSLPDGTALGLRVYGHRRKQDCDDIELLVPPGPADAEVVRAAMATLEPTGMTPIDRALRQAAEDLAGLPGSRAIVLVTDGVESCKGDPVAAAAEVAGTARVHVVGFDVGEDAEAVAQLRDVARAGGGSFSLAGDADQLERALEEAVTLSWSLYDEAGEAVLSRPLSLESHQVLSGTYRLELGTEPVVVLEGLEIERDGVSVVRVVREGAGFVLRGE